MAAYRVLIDDNYHYQNEDERETHGLFGSEAEAIAACQNIVDDFLIDALLPGMTAAALYEQCTGFGDDPFVMPVDPNGAPVTFSAWDYAKARCEVLAGHGGNHNNRCSGAAAVGVYS